MESLDEDITDPLNKDAARITEFHSACWAVLSNLYDAASNGYPVMSHCQKMKYHLSDLEIWQESRLKKLCTSIDDIVASVHEAR